MREFFTSGTVVTITDLLFAVVFLTVLYLIVDPLAIVPAVMLPLMIIVGLACSGRSWIWTRPRPRH